MALNDRDRKRAAILAGDSGPSPFRQPLRAADGSSYVVTSWGDDGFVVERDRERKAGRDEKKDALSKEMDHRSDAEVYVGVDPASDGPDYSGTTVKVQNEDGSWTDITGSVKSFKLDLPGRGERIFDADKISDAMHEARTKHIQAMKGEKSGIWERLVSRGLIQEGDERVETANTPSKGSRIDTEHVRYAAKVYRTEIIEREIEHHLEVMITSLAGEGKKIYVRKDPAACQSMAESRGIKHGPERNHEWVAQCDGWIKTGKTRAGALAALLSCLLDGPFYPRT